MILMRLCTSQIDPRHKHMNLICFSFWLAGRSSITSLNCADVLASNYFAGAHTIGSAHCSAFSDRFQADSKGTQTRIDTSLDKAYANELRKKCPSSVSSSVTVNNDPETSFLFDNQYYRNLMAHKGLFQSDSVLFSDKRTKKMVEDLANDQNSFFERWGQSFLKLTIIGVKSDDEGEIRQSCEVANG